MLAPLAHADRISQQVARLRDLDPRIREQAAKALATSHSSHAVEPLIGAINDPNVQVRRAAATGLGQLHDPRAVQPLLSALHEPYAATCAVSISQDIVTALIQIGWPGVPQLLETFSNPKDAPYNGAIGKALGGISDPRVTERLLEVVKDNPDRRAQEHALEALALREDPRAIPVLAAILNASPQAPPPGSVSLRGQQSAFRDAISDPTTGQRTRAIFVLGAIDTPEAAATIAGVVASPNEFVRQVALRELTEHHRLTLAILAPALESPNTNVQYDALNALSSIHDPQNVQYIRAALESKEERIRSIAVLRLGGILNPSPNSKVLDLLLSATKDPGSRVRAAALSALRPIDDPRVLPAFVAALQDLAPDVRNLAVVTLGQDEAPEAQSQIGQALLQTLHDTSMYVRVNVLHSLLQRQTPQAQEYLIAALKDTSDQVRCAAADDLAKLGDPMAISPLVHALQVERESGVRQHLVAALSHFRDPKAIDPLVALLEHTDSRDDFFWTPRALGDSKNPVARDGLIRLLQNPRSEVREAGATGLAEMQAAIDPSAIPFLLQALKDSNVEVRREAARALVNATDERVVPSLIGALRDGDWDVRFMATLGLVHTHDPRGIGAIVATFADTVINEANSDPQDLAEHGGPEARAAIITALGDPNPHVRLVAAHALRYVNDATTFPALIHVENDPDPTVREAAKLALSGCPRPIPY